MATLAGWAAMPRPNRDVLGSQAEPLEDYRTNGGPEREMMSERQNLVARVEKFLDEVFG